MAMPLAPFPERTMWTVADLDGLPDDGHRYEILHGELLVTPMPSAGHQSTMMGLTLLIGNWCVMYTNWSVRAPGGMYVSETNWFEPDLTVHTVPAWPEPRWEDMPPPILVVEALSRSTEKRDRHRKRPAFLANGVQEVWLLNRRARLVEKWTSASEFPISVSGSITWTPDPALPSLLVPEDKLFGPANLV